MICKTKLCMHVHIKSSTHADSTVTVLQATEKPVEPKFYGHLTFYTTLSCDNKSIFRLYYSMIVATRPETTRFGSYISKILFPTSSYERICSSSVSSHSICSNISNTHLLSYTYPNPALLLQKKRHPYAHIKSNGCQI